MVRAPSYCDVKTMFERWSLAATAAASDFAKEFAESSLVTPLNGLIQLADKVPGVHLKEVEYQGATDKNSIAAEAGHIAGFVADLTVLSVATKGASKSLLGRAGVVESSFTASAIQMGAAGALYGGVFTPTQGNNFGADRLKQAALQGGTMAALGLTSRAFQGVTIFDNSLLNKVAVNSFSGGIVGGANAIATERLLSGRWATAKQIGDQALSFGLFGAAFGALDYGLTRAGGRPAPQSDLVKEQPPAQNVGDNTIRETAKTQYPPVITEMFSPFKRLSDGPILSPRPGMFDSVGAFNPTVVKPAEGRFVMLYRAQDDAGVSRIGYAEGQDGVHFERDDEPILKPEADYEKNGIEDPRLSASLTKPGEWDLTATAFNRDAQLALYRSLDLRNWDRLGVIMPARQGAWNIHWVKSGAQVPEVIAGKQWMYYMGDAADGADQTGVAFSEDGTHWRDATSKPVLPLRPGMFDSKVAEPGPAPIITKDGILLLYNGADDNLAYRTGWALFDKTDPTKLLARSDEPIFEPEMEWEKSVATQTANMPPKPNVVFVEGLVKDGDRYLVYYGGADSRVGVAETRLISVKPES
jgi:predicted GH43/DUF377 family glycosyl hydrolase